MIANVSAALARTELGAPHPRAPKAVGEETLESIFSTPAPARGGIVVKLTEPGPRVERANHLTGNGFGIAPGVPTDANRDPG